MDFRDDAKKRAHKEAQAKGMMILMRQRIKFNKKKAYVSQFIFVKCVKISPISEPFDRQKQNLFTARAAK